VANSGELHCESEGGARRESELGQGEGEGSASDFIEERERSEGSVFMAAINGIRINGGGNGGIEAPFTHGRLGCFGFLAAAGVARPVFAGVLGTRVHVGAWAARRLGCTFEKAATATRPAISQRCRFIFAREYNRIRFSATLGRYAPRYCAAFCDSWQSG